MEALLFFFYNISSFKSVLLDRNVYLFSALIFFCRNITPNIQSLPNLTNPYLRYIYSYIYESFPFFIFFPKASSRKCGVGWEVGLDSTCYQINSDQRKLWAGLYCFELRTNKHANKKKMIK